MSKKSVSKVTPESRQAMPLWAETGGAIRVHYSSLSLHRRCPQAWLYRYEMGLQEDEDEVAPYRDFGSWWSAIRAAETLTRGRKMGSLIYPPSTMRPVDSWEKFDQKVVTVPGVLESSRRWWSKLSPENKDRFVEDLGEELPVRLEGAFDRWSDEWHKETKNERPLGAEVYWERTLPRPAKDAEWDQLDTPDIKLIGFADEIYYREDRNLVAVRDNKTKKNMPPHSTTDDLMDSQLALYAWGLAPSLARLKAPGKVRATGFDRIRSVAAKTPQLTKAGSLSKSVTLYDLATYLVWVGDGVSFEGTKKDGSGAGVYHREDSVIEKLSTPAWRSNFFQRTLTPVSTPLIRSHLRAAVDTAIDIHRTRLRFRRTGEGARNFGDHCKWCPFAELCRAQLYGGPEGVYELKEFGLRAKDGRRVL